MTHEEFTTMIEGIVENYSLDTIQNQVGRTFTNDEKELYNNLEHMIPKHEEE